MTDEDPAQLSRRKQDLHDFQPPLDIVDGAARVCDPFFDGINTGKHWSGMFLKHYFPIDWQDGLQGVEKRHERRQDKAKFGEKAQFMFDK